MCKEIPMTQQATMERAATSEPHPFSPVQLTVAIVAAVALNLIAFSIGSAVGGAMRVNTPGYQDISWVLVVGATVLPLAAAAAVTWLIARRKPAFLTWARWLGVGVALFSLPSPLFVSSDIQTGITLAGMHLIVATAWFVGTRPQSPQA